MYKELSSNIMRQGLAALGWQGAKFWPKKIQYGRYEPVFFFTFWKTDAVYETRGPGALKLVNSIAKYQLQVCQRMYIYALNCIIMKIKYV